MLSMPRIVRPDPRDSCARKLGSPLDRLLADPLSETKNSPNFQKFSQGPEIKVMVQLHAWPR
jgi:hypothetical protein